MQTLINDLLSFSRVGTQGRPLIAVRTEAVLDAVLKSLKRGIEESGAVVARDPLPMVLADELQLSQLLQNLIGNATKFRRDGPVKVHIGAERTATGWNISVRDNGIGVAREHSERIFVIFQRLHRDEEFEGTGIGLATAQRIVQKHRGRIWAESEPGRGSTFFFTIGDESLTPEIGRPSKAVIA